MFVKICGITSHEDALAAVEAGAGAVGFVFYSRSPRSTSPELVKSWIGEIPANVWKVGVFVNESRMRMEEIANDLALDVVQLHGDEKPVDHPRNTRVWRAFRVNGGAITRDYPAEAILLDGPGQGQTFNWDVARGFEGKVIVAGGLTPENVQAAVQATRPWGVDTASGVEAKPGKKDHARMREFIKAALRS